MRDSIDDLRLWMDWAADGVPTEAAQREAFRRAETAFEEGTEFGYAMRELATGEVVGGCGLMPRIGPGAIEIGYWVRSDRHRRGYAVSAAGALTTAAFEWLPEVERVELHIDAANKASAGVAEKLGYEAIRREERERVTPGQSGSCVIWAMNRVRWDQPGGDSTRTQRMSG
jgi:RimJ/RimL family protein N-acetyltransferase